MRENEREGGKKKGGGERENDIIGWLVEWRLCYVVLGFQ